MLSGQPTPPESPLPMHYPQGNPLITEAYLATMIERGDLDAVADAFKQNPFLDLSWRGAENRTLLDYALQAQLPDGSKKLLVEYLVYKMPSPDMLGFQGQSALLSTMMDAEMSDDLRVEIVKILLLAGADPNQINEYASTPLQTLAGLILPEDEIDALLDLLIDAGGNPHLIPPESLLQGPLACPLGIALRCQNDRFIKAYLRPFLRPSTHLPLDFYSYSALVLRQRQMNTLSPQEYAHFKRQTKRAACVIQEPLFKPESHEMSRELAEIATDEEIFPLIERTLDLLKTSF